MNILFQFPTKGRCEKLFHVLDLYYGLLGGDIKNRKFHIVIDHFDYSMNNSTTLHKLASYENLFVSAIPENPTKIKACNYKISNFDSWFDIVVLISDDMIPQIKGYDNIIESEMRNNYPNTDGCLWFNDGYTRNNLCTLSILGKKYYNRFGYIYYPQYNSVWCDNEFTEISKMLNKTTYFEKVIIKHEHPLNNKEIQTDDVYTYNDSLAKTDNSLFEKRRLNKFFIKN
jgi:hypothetical protein